MKIDSLEFVLSAGSVRECPPEARPEIALSGRSNVGKSSLVNALAGRRALAKVSGTPGKTQRLNYFVVNGAFHLVDLPGYGHAEASGAARSAWGRMMQSYLRTRRQLVGVMQLVDCRHPPSREDREMVQWLRDEQMPFIVVANKLDELGSSKRDAAVRRLATELELPPTQPVLGLSNKTGDGRGALLKWVEVVLEAPPQG
ncbi:MAG TPA: ribosome biogenesis GTP-binding protein YihA/YsxC [Candidatus Eisenbacteria bacterium]